jgi:hypothetical protein
MAVGVDGRGRLLVVADVAGAGTPAVQLPAAPWPIADHGWAGVDVAVDSSAAVVVRTLPRMVAVHALATGQTVRAAALPGQPAGVKCLADAAAPALAVIVAGAQALVWDARVAEGGGVVARAKARRIAHTSAACVRHTHAHPMHRPPLRGRCMPWRRPRTGGWRWRGRTARWPCTTHAAGTHPPASGPMHSSKRCARGSSIRGRAHKT